MGLTLISGVVWAVSHHFFYASYDKHRVDGAGLSQAWVVRIGTGMAFLVKTLLVVSATIAFTQHQWLTSRSKSFKIRQIDTISSILSNPLGFFQTRSWLHLPILSLLAVVTWLLPIAAIITPATIVVVAHEEVGNQLSTPPQLCFDPTQYANLQTTIRTDYVGPSMNLLRTAFSSAMTGQISSIPTAFINESYTLDFVGPALRCDFADASLINQTANAYQKQLTGIESQYHYISWVPTAVNKFGLTNATTFLDMVSTDAAHIYIIPNTSVAGPVYGYGMPSNGPYGYDDLLDCKLFNASYQAFLNFSYPSQTVEVKSRTLLNPVNAPQDISEWHRGAMNNNFEGVKQQAQRISDQAVMDCLGRLLVGYEWWNDGYVVTQQTSWSMMSIDWTNRVKAQQGVEELFENITLSMMSSAPLT